MPFFQKFRIQLGLDEKGVFRDAVIIIVGAFFMAFGIAVFLVDARVVPGGISGLAMALYYLTGGALPIGMMMWLFNIPLFYWGVKELGRQFGARTFIGFSMCSFFIDFLRGRIIGFHWIRLHEHPQIVYLREHDFFMNILVGAVLVGFGLGIIFKFRGSTAGSDIIAAIAQKRWGIKPGMSFMVTDTVVILLAGLVIHTKHLALDKPVLILTLYAFVLLFISSRIIDVILDGLDYARSAIIISDESEKIARAIMTDLSRGATALEGRGLYTNTRKEVLYTVLSRKEVTELVQIVKRVDPNAFVIVNDVHEVLGEGFRPRI
jgi:uncharacterized membrane-anchored protein YitT (DUF2179 family)